MKKTNLQEETSWESSSAWYDKIVGAKGHYYHQQVIIPAILRLLDAERKPQPHLLDLGCGQGVLSRHLPKTIKYFGVDASITLIELAQQYATKGHSQFFLHDLNYPLELPFKEFSYATFILSLQNLSHPFLALKTAHVHMKKGAPLFIVLNHPCFRIPRQSSWGIDAQKKMQYRRVDRYMSSLKIPIHTQPSQEEQELTTLSFHHPLSFYVGELKKAGFVIDNIEEWCSDKRSYGKMAIMENRSRQEFPLFLTLIARKL